MLRALKLQAIMSVAGDVKISSVYSPGSKVPLFLRAAPHVDIQELIKHQSLRTLRAQIESIKSGSQRLAIRG